MGAWLDWILLGAVGVLTVVSLVRLVLGLWQVEAGEAMPADFPVAFTQVVVGTGMCALLVPTDLARPVAWWVIFFSVVLLWSCVLIWRSLRGGDGADRARLPLYLHLVVLDLAMLYLFAAEEPREGSGPRAPPAPNSLHDHGWGPVDLPAGAQGGTELALPLLTWVLMTYFLLRAGYAATDIITSHRVAGHQNSGEPVSGRILRSPELGHATSLVINLGVAYLLLVML